MARWEWAHLYNDRRWRKLRASHLAANPLCVRCDTPTPATVCDHVDPHKGDLAAFWTGPFQSLCKYHHDVKTIMEDGGLNSASQTHPDWLPKPACPVVLVSGPPGAGKTTWCREQATRKDQVVDLDDCFTEVCGTHGHEAGKEYLGAALRLRNKLIANLASTKRGTAYVIVSCPSMKEAAWWVDKLGAKHKRIDPGMGACLERVTPRRQGIVRQWYAKAAADDWKPYGARLAFDEHGDPLDPPAHWV